MDENLFDRPPDDAPAQEQHEDQPQGEQQGQLVNKEVWPDAKPGESRLFRCLKVMEKEIEVVAEDEGKEEMPTEGGEKAPMPGGGEDSMMG